MDRRRHHRDGSVTLTGRSGEVRLPKEYVAEHVELAYAETSHASQGRTVDRSFLFLDGPTGAAGIYVPMTRGRESNEVFVAVRGEETPVDVISEALSRTWIDRPAIAVRDELRPPAVDDGGSVVRAMPGRQLEHAVERAAEVQAALRKIDLDREHKQRTHRQAVGQLDAARRQLRAMEHQLSVALAESERFDRPLVRHLHRAEVESARTQLGWLPAAVDRQRTKVADLERQVDSSKGRSLADRLDDGRKKRLEAELAELRSRLTDDAHARGRALVKNVPDVVLHRLGPPPGRAEAREAWIETAGRMAQHQAAWDIAEEHLLGRKPKIFHDDAYQLSWQAAAKSISALDRSVGRPLERQVPTRGLSR